MANPVFMCLCHHVVLAANSVGRAIWLVVRTTQAGPAYQANRAFPATLRR